MLLDHDDSLYMMMVKESQQQWQRLGDTSGIGSGTHHVADLVFFLQFGQYIANIFLDSIHFRRKFEHAIALKDPVLKK